MMSIRLAACRRLGHGSAATVLSMDRAGPATAPAPVISPAIASTVSPAVAPARRRFGHSSAATVLSMDRAGPAPAIASAVAPAAAPASSILLRASAQGDGLIRCPHRHMSVLYYLRKLPKRFKEFKKLQMNVVERQGKNQKYPPEIAAYLWLIGLKARVRFTNGRWYTDDVQGLRQRRPVMELMQYSIDAIDASGTLLDYHGMADIIQLPRLQMLSLEGCPHIDDSSLGRLVHLRESLTHLNVSRCPQITQHGLASLTHLRNLERLNMTDLPRVAEAKLVASMLEDALPRLRVSLVTEEVKRLKQQQDKWRQAPDQGQDATG